MNLESTSQVEACGSVKIHSKHIFTESGLRKFANESNRIQVRKLIKEGKVNHVPDLLDYFYVFVCTYLIRSNNLINTFFLTKIQMKNN